MKFNIQSKLLLSHLSAASKVVNSNNTITILDNFLFVLEGNQLTITCSDLETTLTTSVEVQSPEGKGSFAAKVKTLLEMLKELPDTALSFDIDDNNLEIAIDYEHGQFRLVGINGDEFPKKEQRLEEARSFSMLSKKIVSGIQHTLFSVSTEQIRPVMTGIFWDIKPDEIVFVSSDTHKLVRYRELNMNIGLEQSFILPSKPASILSSILDKNDDEVKITTDSKSATFESKDYSLTCRFINRRYPNYNSVIPQETRYLLNVDRMSMLNALRRVSVFSDSTTGEVKLELSPDEILMSSQDLNFSTAAKESVQCDYDGDEMSIGFTDVNIKEVLKNIESENVCIKLLDPLKSGIFLPSEQKEDEELLILLVPMRL